MRGTWYISSLVREIAGSPLAIIHLHLVSSLLIQSSEARPILQQRHESDFVVSRHNSAFCRGLQTLESLRAREPGWVVASQPPLGNTITPLGYGVRKGEERYRRHAK
jgi:hypothetical protein